MTIDLDESRDGPTEEFARHHVTVRRAGRSPGNRVQSRLESLLRLDYITPAQHDAGRRFRDDHLVGIVGRTRSCLDISVRTGNDDGGAHRHDAAGRFLKAQEYLDRAGGARQGGLLPSQAVLRCVLEDVSFSALGRSLGVEDEIAKSVVAQHLAVLAAHYASVDAIGGKSMTPHTKEAALAALEVENDPAPDAPASARGRVRPLGR